MSSNIVDIESGGQKNTASSTPSWRRRKAAKVPSTDQGSIIPWKLIPAQHHLENSDFLKAAFAGISEDELVWHAAFPLADSPDWGGSGVNPHNEQDMIRISRKKGWNNYFTISSFVPGATGRRNSMFSRIFMLSVDDIGAVGHPGDELNGAKASWTVMEGLPEPHAITISSEDNHQLHYFLVPDERLPYARALQQGFIDKILKTKADPGMKGGPRFMRLPRGTNNKLKYKPADMPAKEWEGYTQEWIHWNPGMPRYTIEELAEGLGFELDPENYANKAGYEEIDANDDPWFDLVLDMWGKGAPIMDKGPDGKWVDITCPWVDSHTDGADNGAAYGIGGGFCCHHGSCQSGHGKDGSSPRAPYEVRNLLLAHDDLVVRGRAQHAASQESLFEARRIFADVVHTVKVPDEHDPLPRESTTPHLDAVVHDHPEDVAEGVKSALRGESSWTDVKKELVDSHVELTTKVIAALYAEAKKAYTLDKKTAISRVDLSKYPTGPGERNANELLRRYAFLSAENEVVDLDARPSRFNQIKLPNWMNAHAGDKTEIDTPDGPKEVPSSKLWQSSSDKKVLDGCEYSPCNFTHDENGAPVRVYNEGGSRIYNTFDFKYHGDVDMDPNKPLEKYYGVWTDHVDYLIQDPDERDLFVEFCAHIVQFPGIRPQVSPLFISKAHGTGRGILVDTLRHAIGTQHYSTSSLHDLATSQYHDHLYGNLICNIAETRGEDGKGALYTIDDTIRDLISAGVLTLNLKGSRKLTTEVFARVIMASNNVLFPCVIPPEDRRIWVIRGTDNPRSREHFKDMVKLVNPSYSMGKTIAAHLFHYLRTLEIKRFDSSMPAPKNEARANIVQGSRSSSNEFLGTFQGQPWHKGLVTVSMLQRYSQQMFPVDEQPELKHIKTGLRHEAVRAAPGGDSNWRPRGLDGKQHNVWIINDADKWVNASPKALAEEFRTADRRLNEYLTAKQLAHAEGNLDD